MPVVELQLNNTGVARLLINRPEARNALNWSAQKAFAKAVDQLADSSVLRAVIVTGVGDVFIAGADLKELSRFPEPETAYQLTATMGDALEKFASIPVPTIAAINGPARGGGAEIALACDIRMMADSASIAFVHASLGLVPGWGGGQRLARLVGASVAIELLASCRIVHSEEAYRIGLVNHVVPAKDLYTEALKLAEQIIQNDQMAIAKIKSLLIADHAVSRADLLHERTAFMELWQRPERVERFERFRKEK